MTTPHPISARGTRQVCRRLAAALVSAAAACMALMSAVPAAAETTAAGTITWQPESLQRIYNPPAGFYSYAPSVIHDGDTTYIWTCHNDSYRVIRDHVYLTKIVDGTIVEDRPVLFPSSTGWDSFHNCDPSIVAGNYHYRSARYRYAMFYLGNDVNASRHNQIGVAFAHSLEGPWIKDPDPIVAFTNTQQWGAGQPSAVSLDSGSGRLLLFYTQGDTATRAYRRVVNLTDADQPIIGPPLQLTTKGLTNRNGADDWLNNYDVAYQPARHRFLIIREQHPYPKGNPSWIGASLQVDSIDAASVWRGGGSWTVLGTIDPQLTGLARNHNAGLTRTDTGALPDPDAIDAVFTSSCAGPTCDSLYSYDLWQIHGTLR